MSFQRHIFTVGKRYRVREAFNSGVSEFFFNEVLSFERDGYSRYDNSFVYEFRSNDGQVKSWLLHENSPVEVWMKYFEPEGE